MKMSLVESPGVTLVTFVSPRILWLWVFPVRVLGRPKFSLLSSGVFVYLVLAQSQRHEEQVLRKGNREEHGEGERQRKAPW